MIKLIFKINFIALLCSAPFFAQAQIGYNYAQYSFGVAASLNTPVSTDVTNHLKHMPSAQLNFTYNDGPFVNYVLEGQFGDLQAGDVHTKYGRKFNNHFWAFALRAQLQAGELIDYSQSQVANAFKNLYLSTGIGFISNRVDKAGDNTLPPGVIPPGDNNTQVPYIPLRIGYELKLFNAYQEPKIRIDLAYQYNKVFDDNLDGYKAGKYNDAFSQFIIGIKYSFGGVTSYRKQIFY